MIRLYISTIAEDFRVIYMLTPTNEVLVAHADGSIGKSYFLNADDIICYSGTTPSLLQYIGSL